MELFGGCCGVFALLFGGLGVMVVRMLGPQRMAHSRLIRLMVEFVSGSERNPATVGQIHVILLRTFLHDDRYEEVMTAVASFVPGGAAPFLDEARLAEVFRAFLKKRRVVVPEYLPEQAGVWPPAPKR